MTLSITAKIQSTEIEAEYQGNVYERTVTVLIDGNILQLFEGKNIVTDSDLGSTIDLELRAHLLKEVEVVEDCEFGLQQAADRESKWSATITGRITREATKRKSVAGDDREVIIDAGSGAVILQLDGSETREMELERGDIVRADCGRVDIIGRR